MHARRFIDGHKLSQVIGCVKPSYRRYLYDSSDTPELSCLGPFACSVHRLTAPSNRRAIDHMIDPVPELRTLLKRGCLYDFDWSMLSPRDQSVTGRRRGGRHRLGGDHHNESPLYVKQERLDCRLPTMYLGAIGHVFGSGFRGTHATRAACGTLGMLGARFKGGLS